MRCEVSNSTRSRTIDVNPGKCRKLCFRQRCFGAATNRINRKCTLGLDHRLVLCLLTVRENAETAPFSREIYFSRREQFARPVASRATYSDVTAGSGIGLFNSVAKPWDGTGSGPLASCVVRRHPIGLPAPGLLQFGHRCQCLRCGGRQSAGSTLRTMTHADYRPCRGAGTAIRSRFLRCPATHRGVSWWPAPGGALRLPLLFRLSTGGPSGVRTRPLRGQYPASRGRKFR